jgi:pantoate--beta-alanine ligase
MIIAKDIKSVRKFRKDNALKTIGFVPTMGFLHQGHLSLMKQSKKDNDLSAASIFVNPIQFNNAADFENYPIDIQKDLDLLESIGIDMVFLPDASIMYPEGFKTSVSVSDLTSSLEGASRPGHFDGVTTVVSKLFNLVQPDRSYFGKKDAQQVLVIEKMVKDLDIPVEIIRGDTIREKDGLAMSSRNARLSAEQRQKAVILYESLQLAEKMIASGERNADVILKAMHELIEKEPLAEIDYISMNQSETLEKAESPIFGEVLISMAVFFGEVRLIDNTIVKL